MTSIHHGTDWINAIIPLNAICLSVPFAKNCCAISKLCVHNLQISDPNPNPN